MKLYHVLVLVVILSLFDIIFASLPNDTNCGVPFYKPDSPVKRIVDGAEVAANSWPWMALLKFDGHLVCGGTIVRNDTGSMLIITSAACVDGSLSDASRWEVRLGVFSRSTAQHEPYFQSFKVKNIIKHSDFNSAHYQNDIAIMDLEGEIKESNGVGPACVTRNIYTAGENCVSLGWGLNGTGASAERLQQVFKPVLSVSTCRANLQQSLFDERSMMCAGRGQEKAGICSKDTGGPLLCKRNDKWYLTGIISWRDNCGSTVKPSVYTNVFEYVTSGWLRKYGGI